MKKVICFFIIVSGLRAFSQEKQYSSYFDLNYFRGNITLHNTDIQHLIQGHPEGLILGWNRETYGKKEWEQLYNYPDYGISFIYQDLKNETLGRNYGIYAHYNFYFFKRKLMLRIGQGLAYTTNPYDKEDNFRNVAFGSDILSSTYALLNYKKEALFKRINAQIGLAFIHYSNANVKAPNTSINSIAFNVGMNYQLDAGKDPEYINDELSNTYSERIKYNIVFRTGINESDIIGSGQFPFYIISAYADKRINKKSALQFGADMFFSQFLKETITYEAIAFPEFDVTGDEDYKRLGIFVGHELFVNKASLLTQLGYYAYYPFDFEGRTYVRVGLKRYFGDNFFGSLTLKSHWAKAEAVEFGIGIRL